MFEIPNTWAGTSESFDLLAAAMDAVWDLQARGSSSDMFTPPPTFEARDGVGIVAIKGPLMKGSAGWMRNFGVTGYEDIMGGVLDAAKAKGVKSILLDVASGGGMVEGCDECAEFLADIGKLKPIITYAGGNMQSAAYWTGSVGKKRFASRTSMVGSIGAVATVMDMSKMYEKEGIKPQVFRSGKYKAIVNGFEPLSDEAKKFIQKTVESISAIFESRVALNLGVDAKTVRDKMGQGREFFGAEAVQVGLLDGIATFNEAFAVAKSLAR